MTEIRDTDYGPHVEILGTAHFTQRSLREAARKVVEVSPRDLALELDRRRFDLLNNPHTAGHFSPYHRKSEFTGASDALGNTDADIWLIDMEEPEIEARMQRSMTKRQLRNLRKLPWLLSGDPMERQLWERGLKNLVVEGSQKRMDALRKYAPAVWQVLIPARNALMAARLAWIVDRRLDQYVENPKVLAVLGAAHANGVEDLLSNPRKITEDLRKHGIEFTEPERLRRVKVG